MNATTTEVIEFTDTKEGPLLAVNRYTVDISPADFELELRNSGLPYFIDAPGANKTFTWFSEEQGDVYGTFHDPAHPADDPALLTLMAISIDFF